MSICGAMSYNDTRALLLMQQTGLMDSLNAIRAIGMDYQLPICMMVGLQGKEPELQIGRISLLRRTHHPAGARRDADFLSRDRGTVRRVNVDRQRHRGGLPTVANFRVSDHREAADMHETRPGTRNSEAARHRRNRRRGVSNPVRLDGDQPARPELCRHRGNGSGVIAWLGLALANPEREVIVFDGDGSLLMNLGSLVTVANAAPRNFHHFVFENGVYEVNGAHPIPGQNQVDFAAMARAAGYRHVEIFSELTDFEAGVGDFLRPRTRHSR